MSADSKRRIFLKKSWNWLRFGAILSMTYPALKFLHFSTPRQPVTVKVTKEIPVGGHAVENDFILFVGEGGPWAVSRLCTHLGCRLNFVEQENILLCPCHQSRFSPRGKLLGGPAKRDLPNYRVAQLGEAEGKGYLVTI